MPGGMLLRQEVKTSPCLLTLSDEMLETSLKESFSTVLTFSHSLLYMIRDILLRKILQLVQQCICKDNIEVSDLEGADDIFRLVAAFKISRTKKNRNKKGNHI